ncbi:MAG: hypothetical protein HC781_15265 [Leptolyngbyaceae cyanobacterium CSU_1_4]|nr:hypothetical protein [Leptolyngbyaceae cyanobacterium CSU_1_4]
MRQGLRQLQRALNLTDQQVGAIEARVNHEFQTQTHAYRESLLCYEQAFSNAIRQEFPLSAPSQNQLWQLQDSLGLQRADVIKIEGQLVAQAGNPPPPLDFRSESPLSPPSSSPPSDLPPNPQPELQPDPQPTHSQPTDPQPTHPQPTVTPALDPQDFRLPDPLEAKLVDDIDLEPFTTSPPFSRFAEVSTTHLPFSGFAEPGATLQPPPPLPPHSDRSAQSAL